MDKKWTQPVLIILLIFVVNSIAMSWQYGPYLYVIIFILLFLYWIYYEINRVSSIQDYTCVGEIVEYRYEIDNANENNTVLKVKLLKPCEEEKIVEVRAQYILRKPVIGAHLKLYIRNGYSVEILKEHEGFITFLRIFSIIITVVLIGTIYWIAKTKR